MTCCRGFPNCPGLLRVPVQLFFLDHGNNSQPAVSPGLAKDLHVQMSFFREYCALVNNAIAKTTFGRVFRLEESGHVRASVLGKRGCC